MNNPNFNEILSEALAKYNRKTNADRIRSMSDEELAELLDGSICPEGCNQLGECEANEQTCKQCWLDWLKEEVKEE